MAACGPLEVRHPYSSGVEPLPPLSRRFFLPAPGPRVNHPLSGTIRRSGVEIGQIRATLMSAVSGLTRRSGMGGWWAHPRQGSTN